MSKSIILTFHTSIEFCTLSKFHASIANACTMRLNHSSSEHHVGSVISGLPPSQKSISSFWVICVVWQGNFSKAALKIPGCCGHLLLFPAHAIETDWIVLYPGCLAWLDAVQKNANMHKYLCLFYLVPHTSHLDLDLTSCAVPSNLTCCDFHKMHQKSRCSTVRSLTTTFCVQKQ